MGRGPAKQAAKKIFSRDDAYNFFKNAVIAGGIEDVDDSILKAQFETFLKNNEKFSYNGGPKKEKLANGVVRTIKPPEYDYNAVINKIGDDFGYDLSKANKIDDIVLEDNKSYADSYRSFEKKKRALEEKRKLLQGRKIAQSNEGYRNRTAQDIEEYVGDRRDVTREELKEYRSRQRRARNPESNKKYHQIHEDFSDVEDVDLNSILDTETDPLFRRVGENKDGFETRLQQRKVQQLEQLDEEMRDKINNPPRWVVGNRAKQAYKDHINRQWKQQESRIVNTFNGRSASASIGGNETDIAQDVLDNATGKDGVGLWQKAKEHPIIATTAVLGTVWGISELVEDDSF